MTRDELIEKNLGLVHSCAKKFIGKGIEYDDLYSSGCVGLIKAIDNFDESLGFKLSTYAVPVILGEIKRLFRDGGMIKVSRSLKELSLKATKIADEYKKEHSSDIPISELAKMLNTDVYKASEALSVSTPVMSLTAHSEDGERELDVPTVSVEDSLIEKLSLFDIIKTLEKSDRELIALRYFKHKTQVDTAKALGLTQVQVSRREKKILSIMRQKLI
ncbi:MAG: sigma-70 family RNA polymerase sigma factor [Ruminococcaceae bacterium]|nr:sigma-70 family RNA polymerase sigma factor [Oscillospiraceae bacterium]